MDLDADLVAQAATILLGAGLLGVGYEAWAAMNVRRRAAIRASRLWRENFYAMQQRIDHYLTAGVWRPYVALGTDADFADLVHARALRDGERWKVVVAARRRCYLAESYADPGRPAPARDHLVRIYDELDEARRVLANVDRRWPTARPRPRASS